MDKRILLAIILFVVFGGIYFFGTTNIDSEKLEPRTKIKHENISDDFVNTLGEKIAKTNKLININDLEITWETWDSNGCGPASFGYGYSGDPETPSRVRENLKSVLSYNSCSDEEIKDLVNLKTEDLLEKMECLGNIEVLKNPCGPK